MWYNYQDIPVIFYSHFVLSVYRITFLITLSGFWSFLLRKNRFYLKDSNFLKYLLKKLMLFPLVLEDISNWSRESIKCFKFNSKLFQLINKMFWMQGRSIRNLWFWTAWQGRVGWLAELNCYQCSLKYIFICIRRCKHCNINN